MQRALVLDKNKRPLMPCHPARARQLLRKGKAAVFRLYPFTIILRDRDQGETQPLELKFDTGSKVTGIALVLTGKNGLQVVWAAHLQHRGQAIRDALLARRGIRGSRRNRKTRYRMARFLNRTRPKGWLAPSLKSRVDNIDHWTRRLMQLTPVDRLASELVRFDMQKLRNPEIDGIEYQQGTLLGFEVKEYLLLKWNHQCAYCPAKDVPLEVEHVVSKRKGGSNSITNLVVSCRKCNKDKGTQPLDIFLKNDQTRLVRIKKQLKSPLRDAAAINSIRYAIGDRLESYGLPVSFGTGGQTKYNRTQQGYCKDHWIDAACVGNTGQNVLIHKNIIPLTIKATGRGSRQMCRVDRFGFPRTQAKTHKVINGFSTGDIVKAVVTKGKYIGTYIGRVAVRSAGNFNIKTTNGVTYCFGWKHFQLLQKNSGYIYN